MMYVSANQKAVSLRLHRYIVDTCERYASLVRHMVR
jgi:hypothetical protein